MPRAHRPPALPVALVAGLLWIALTSCSGEQDPGLLPADPTADPTAASTAGPAADHTTELAALYAGNSALPQDLGEGRCFALALQERLSEDELVTAGIVGPDGGVVEALPIFDAATATAWVDAQLSCVGFIESSTRALLTQTRGELDAEAYAACLGAAISDAEIRAALTQTLSGGFDTPEVARLAEAQASCTG